MMPFFAMFIILWGKLLKKIELLEDLEDLEDLDEE
jgi:hypothetical protein